MKRLLGLAAAILLCLLALLLLARLFESHLVFFPNFPSRLAGEWNPRGLEAEDVFLKTEDGVQLHAWWIPASRAEFTFVAFHGNASNIANRADVYAFLKSVPANILAVEYRGYGKSEGRPGEARFYRDAAAAWEYVARRRGVSPNRIVAFGQSIGTPVAAHLASQREVGAVVLEAPFPSAGEVARRLYPFLPGLQWVIRSRFATSEYLSAAQKPLLVVHCERDPVIPLAMGEAVFRQAPEPKRMLRIAGACHEEASLVEPERYRIVLREFLNSL